MWKIWVERKVIEVRTSHNSKIDHLVQNTRIQDEISFVYFMYKTEELSTDTTDCNSSLRGVARAVSSIESLPFFGQ